MEKFLTAVRNMFNVPDLRRRILFTLGLLAVYRFGAHVGAPGINKARLDEVWRDVAGTLLGVLDLFSGGNFRTISVFALGVTPYITASIILQLMTVVSPQLKKLQEEGEMGRQKINQWTRYLTVVLAAIQTTFVAHWLQVNGVGAPTWGFLFNTVLTLTTGTMFVMWLGEQITERGIGNGISLLIFAGIVVRLPSAIFSLFEQLSTGQIGPIRVLFLVIMAFVVIGAIVFVERGHRRIVVQYAKRVVGRRQYGGSSTHIPLKVNTGGVIPVIFASSILSFIGMGQTLFESGTWARRAIDQLAYGMPLYNLLYVVGIIFFAYFYTAIIFNPDDVAENMRKYGGFIPGIRPGKRTAEYIDTILSRITLVGAFYLAAVAILPEFLITGFKVAPIPFIGDRLDAALPQWFTQGLGVTFYFGGTSLLIVVGVAMDTVQQVESQLIMRHYDGFMKKTRIRGRRG